MRNPDFSNGRIRVWRSNLERRRPGQQERPRSSLCDFLVHFPGAHAFWQWWSISIVHLRPVSGASPAFLQRPTSSHEVLFIARNIDIDGGQSLELVDPDNPMTWGQILTPLDLVHQVDSLTDEMAKRLGDLIAEHLLRGVPPDSDFRSHWRELLDGTAEHLRAGHHLPA